ncbi:hypothetical protein TWF730_009045 [Orbilia blumenaviensis]|uniref:N-acetyltransferase domain-containing protein n=1 Tax=Orbilia blumenaviensis TaxID=1796055 RepID=A0AAV9UY35_9PEZI
MTLRPATSTDLPAILEIHDYSLPDHVYAIFTHPYRHIHPHAFEEYMSSSPRKKLLSASSNEYNIAIPDENGKLVAWAFWRRNVGEKHALKIQNYKATAEAILNGEVDVSSLLPPKELKELGNGESGNSSLSHPRQALSNFHTLRDTVKHFSKDHYYLSHLLVHPDYKRRGYGYILTLWGLYYAAQEGLPAYLTASAEGERLYRKLGFKVIGEKSFPAISEMNDEDRAREEDIFGKEQMEEQFKVQSTKLMAWEGTKEDDIFRDKVAVEKILSVPIGV